MARKRSRLASLIADDQYAPKERELRDQARRARRDYRAALGAASAAGDALIGEARRARPDIARIYDDAAAQKQAARSRVSDILAGLGSGADAFRAASASEAGLQDRLLGDAKAQTLASFREREVGAREGALSAVNQAGGNYNEQITKIRQGQADTAADKGRTTTIEGAKLRRENRDYRLRKEDSRTSRRGADLAERKFQAELTGRDPVTGKKYAGAGSRLTQLQNNAAISQIDHARAWVKQFGHLSDTLIRKALVNGTTVPGKPDDTGKVGPSTKIPAFDPDFVNAALDLERKGALSDLNVRRLTDPDRHGLRLPREWTARSRQADQGRHIVHAISRLVGGL